VYAFCSIGCRTRFIKDPGTFLAAPGSHTMEAG
jgi:YHS domain-containing protein